MARKAATQLGLESPYDADKREVGDMVATVNGVVVATVQRQRLQSAITYGRIAWQDENAIGFVSDRTSFDDLAYTLLHGCSERQYQELTDAVLLQWRRLAPTYQRVIFCPLASFWKHGGDPARVSDLTYHKQFEETLLKLLERSNVHVDRSLCRVSDVGRAQWLHDNFGVSIGSFLG